MSTTNRDPVVTTGVGDRSGWSNSPPRGRGIPPPVTWVSAQGSPVPFVEQAQVSPQGRVCPQALAELVAEPWPIRWGER